MPYNKLLTNLAFSSRTGVYWPSVVFVRSSRQYSPVRPSHSVSKRLVFASLKGGFYLNATFPPLDMALMEYLVPFQAIQKLYTRPVNLYCKVFCEFLGDFWVYLGGDNFS